MSHSSHPPRPDRPDPHPHAHRRPAPDLPVDPDLDAMVRGGPGSALPPRLRLRPIAAVALGGFFGGLARYGIGAAWPAGRTAFPTATFVINTSGAFVLACVLLLVREVLPPTTVVRPLLGTGFCGAYTTFSSVAVSGDQLVHSGRPGVAAGYVTASLVAGLAVVAATLGLGRRLAERAGGR